MMRSSLLALFMCSGVACSASMSFAGDVARPPVRPTAPVSSITITAPQRLTGFYHPHGVGVAPASGPIVEDPAVVTPVAPVGPIVGGGNSGQPVCGCAAPFPTYAPPGLAVGGYSAFLYGGPVDPHTLHFGPGYHRYQNMIGHVRFPYYSYRAPWYHPGPPSFNLDTNLPW